MAKKDVIIPENPYKANLIYGNTPVMGTEAEDLRHVRVIAKTAQNIVDVYKKTGEPAFKNMTKLREEIDLYRQNSIKKNAIMLMETNIDILQRTAKFIEESNLSGHTLDLAWQQFEELSKKLAENYENYINSY